MPDGRPRRPCGTSRGEGDVKGDHGFKKRPKGSTAGGYVRPRVQIGFDDATRRAVSTLAKRNNRSFAAEIRTLVAKALEDDR